jgi:hypothetical protein
MPLSSEDQTLNQSVLLFTGHLIDNARRAEPRFPMHLAGEARDLLHIYIDQELRLQPPDVAVCSLGAGGDMIFADEILKRGIPLIIYLPFDEQRFLSGSVIYPKSHPDDDPSEWEREFRRILASAADVRFTDGAETGVPDNSDENPYARCNRAMIDYALEVSRGKEGSVSAIALLKPGKSGDNVQPGGTAHYVDELMVRNIPVQIIWPGTAANPVDLQRLGSIVPVFSHLDSTASFYQNKWKKRLKAGIIILAVIAFFDAFVTSPDYFFGGYGSFVRMSALMISMAGVFITLHLQLSDKTSLSQWTNSRARAEQIRSEIWFYLFNIWSENNRFGPYGEGEFQSYIKKVKPHSWHGHIVNLEKLTGLKQMAVRLTVPEKTGFYKRYRLDDQLSYFRKKRDYFKRRLTLYNSATYLFLIISITYGALKIMAEFYTLPAFISDFSPLGLMIGFIALVSSYSESNNSKEMEYKYRQMAEGIETLSAGSESIRTESGFALFVKQCETFLRTQNNEWSIKKLNQ